MRDVVELVLDPEYRRARAAYHDWVRDFVSPLQSGAPLNDAAIKLAAERADDLLLEEQRIIRTATRSQRWSVTQTVAMVLQASASIGLAVAIRPVAPIALGLGLVGQGATFADWVAGKRAETPA